MYSTSMSLSVSAICKAARTSCVVPYQFKTFFPLTVHADADMFEANKELSKGISKDIVWHNQKSRLIYVSKNKISLWTNITYCIHFAVVDSMFNLQRSPLLPLCCILYLSYLCEKQTKLKFYVQRTSRIYVLHFVVTH